MLDQVISRLLGEIVKPPSPAAMRDPHYPRRPLTAKPMVLTDDVRVRGGRKSRRRIARTWKEA